MYQPLIIKGSENNGDATMQQEAIKLASTNEKGMHEWIVEYTRIFH